MGAREEKKRSDGESKGGRGREKEGGDTGEQCCFSSRMSWPLSSRYKHNFVLV